MTRLQGLGVALAILAATSLAACNKKPEAAAPGPPAATGDQGNPHPQDATAPPPGGDQGNPHPQDAKAPPPGGDQGNPHPQ